MKVRHTKPDLNASKGSCGEAKNMYKKYVFSDSFFVQAIGGRSNWSDGLMVSLNRTICDYSRWVTASLLTRLINWYGHWYRHW